MESSNVTAAQNGDLSSSAKSRSKKSKKKNKALAAAAAPIEVIPTNTPAAAVATDDVAVMASALDDRLSLNEIVDANCCAVAKKEGEDEMKCNSSSSSSTSPSSSSSPTSSEGSSVYRDPATTQIEYAVYVNELQMPDIMRLIQKDLSEPYSIYTYRYFIHNWPKLCFLAMHGTVCVGAIVCKLDIHRQQNKRGYIAMLAVDKEYRKLKIGTNLVQKAIEVCLQFSLGEFFFSDFLHVA